MNDEAAIRTVVDEWARATKAGEIDKVLSLMAEDAVFLTTGNPPMRGRKAFEESFRAQNAGIESRIETEEVRVSGDMAYMINRLRVSIKSGPDSATRNLSGYVLTIFRKESDGRWVLSRDANMLTPET